MEAIAVLRPALPCHVTRPRAQRHPRYPDQTGCDLQSLSLQARPCPRPCYLSQGLVPPSCHTQTTGHRHCDRDSPRTRPAPPPAHGDRRFGDELKPEATEDSRIAGLDSPGWTGLLDQVREPGMEGGARQAPGTLPWPVPLRLSNRAVESSLARPGLLGSAGRALSGMGRRGAGSCAIPPHMSGSAFHRVGPAQPSPT